MMDDELEVEETEDDTEIEEETEDADSLEDEEASGFEEKSSKGVSDDLYDSE